MLIRPSSKVIVKFLQVMMKHGASLATCLPYAGAEGWFARLWFERAEARCQGRAFTVGAGTGLHPVVCPQVTSASSRSWTITAPARSSCRCWVSLCRRLLFRWGLCGHLWLQQDGALVWVLLTASVQYSV